MGGAASRLMASSVSSGRGAMLIMVLFVAGVGVGGGSCRRVASFL